MTTPQPQPPRRPTPAAVKRDQKRQNKQAAAARRAAARRRRQWRNAALAALAALVVIGGAVWLFGGFRSGHPTASTSAAPSASASGCPAAKTASPPAGAFPPVPAGADPALKTKPVIKPGTGDLADLKVTTLVEGKGEPTRACQSVVVNYVGVNYKTGEEFDSSWKNSQTFSLVLGDGQVIKGWDQGLVGVKVGSRVQLDIPANLAYGEGSGPTNGPLRFVVDVLAAS